MYKKEKLKIKSKKQRKWKKDFEEQITTMKCPCH